ncbi:SSI family serine proteinase inhibitor [Streptomyces sp. NPDC085946]|uniref:SSI family serine proteinase inhibitor n=1 Tax=Streptomyces sp. NPDC085946 TaxID=3365744 RepID=UPI0037D93293
MTYTSAKTAGGALSAAAALLVACAAPAQAAVREPVPANWLYFTVTPGETPSASARGTLLLCDPPAGHGRATGACAELDAAGGDIAAVPAKDVFCPMSYAPVTVHATGQWRGRPLEYTRTFPNPCVMAARTGQVFASGTTL